MVYLLVHVLYLKINLLWQRLNNLLQNIQGSVTVNTINGLFDVFDDNPLGIDS